jgi:hypothetical protein
MESMSCTFTSVRIGWGWNVVPTSNCQAVQGRPVSTAVPHRTLSEYLAAVQRNLSMYTHFCVQRNLHRMVSHTCNFALRGILLQNPFFYFSKISKCSHTWSPQWSVIQCFYFWTSQRNCIVIHVQDMFIPLHLKCISLPVVEKERKGGGLYFQILTCVLFVDFSPLS